MSTRSGWPLTKLVSKLLLLIELFSFLFQLLKNGPACSVLASPVDCRIVTVSQGIKRASRMPARGTCNDLTPSATQLSRGQSNQSTRAPGESFAPSQPVCLYPGQG